MRFSGRTGVALALAGVLSLGFVGLRPGGEDAVPSAESAPGQAAQAEKPSFSTGRGDRFAPQRVLVAPAPGVTPQELADLHRRVGGSRADRVAPGSRVRQVRLPASVSVPDAVRRYEASPLVRFAEPDFVVRPSSTIRPNDPDYTRLWGLENTGQLGGLENADINAPGAWGLTTGTDGPPVAVIDTGMDITHPDLKANLWTNPGEIPGNGIDDDDNGYVDDVHGWDFLNDDNSVFDGAEDDHGTHVAGTLAAAGGNGVGITGVNWRARMMSLKFLGPEGGYVSDAVAALDYAVAHGARVSNNSWGGGGASTTLSEAVTRAAAAGHLLVAAAGNGGADGIGDDNDVLPEYPASYPHENVVSVAASTRLDTLATFSNYGATSVDLAAPGADILSTLTNGAYGTYSGTSMATPHVSGAAVLTLAAEPSLSVTQLKARLLESVDPAPAFRQTATGGRLNIGKALDPTSTSTADVTLALSRATLPFGTSTALSGVLSVDGAALADQEVVLQSRALGATAWTTLPEGTLRTDSAGRFSLADVRPSRHTDYRARFAGADEVARASVSQVRRANVRVRVSLSVPRQDLELGRTRVLSGVVRPAHTGTVRLIIRRNGTVVARRDLALDDSRYRFGYQPTRPGRYAFVVRRFADSDHLGNRSPKRAFRVVR